MAIDRRKMLETARKHAQRGAREKALAQYETLLRLDPRDTRLRLEIGDVHRRWGRCEQAIAHYGRVAGQFRSEGFEARAVAVWKRILRIDSKRYEAHVALSDLYQHLGMQSQAVGALQDAIDGLNGEGRTREALENLRRMGQLDPTNTTSRQKVADLLVKEGMVGDATIELEETIAELERVENFGSVPALYQRLLELNPESVPFRVALAHSCLRMGRVSEAESHAQQVLESDPEHVEASEVLLEVCRQLGKDSEVAEVSRRLAESYRDRGDDDRASQITQRLPGSGGFDLGHEGDLRLGSPGEEIDFGPDEIENVDLGESPWAPTSDVPDLEIDAGSDLSWDLEPTAADAKPSVLRDDERTPQGLSDSLPVLGEPEEELEPVQVADDRESVAFSPEGVEIEIACETAMGACDDAVQGSEVVETAELPSVDEELEEAKFYLDQSLYEEAEAILNRVLTLAPGHPTAAAYLAEAADLRTKSLESKEPPALSPEPEGVLDRDAKSHEAKGSETDSCAKTRQHQVQSAIGDGMEEIFADFKRGVNEELAAHDIETRFDLGIAYKEMGLLEDALVEFEACRTFEPRRIDSLHMMALCARDLDRPRDAVCHLEEALASSGLPRDRRDGLCFDLGLAHESLGEFEVAQDVYRQIEDSGFPGLHARVEALESGKLEGLPTQTARAEEFESFDDLVEEAEALDRPTKKISFV